MSIDESQVVSRPLTRCVAGQTEETNRGLVESLRLLTRRLPVLRKRLTLIHCPTFNVEAFNIKVARNRGYYAYPPTGLQCLKAAVQDLGVDVDILDLNFKLLRTMCDRDGGGEDLVDVERVLEAHHSSWDASVIGVSAGVIVSNIFGVRNHPFVRTLRYLTDRGRTLVLAGGVIATNEWRGLLRRGLAHVVFEGESENKLRFFLNALFDLGLEVPSTPGIHFVFEGRILETRGQKDVVRFRGNLIPTYDQIPIERYHEVGCLSPFSRAVGPERIYGTVQLNRGCRGRCTFCGVGRFMGPSVRPYEIDRVVAEIECLVSARGVRHFEWLDDDLLANRAMIVDILTRIAALRERVDGRLTWAANNGLIAASLDEDLLRVMVASGCVGFRIGIESGNEAMLRKIRKPASKRTLRNAAELVARFPSLFVVGCYIIGFEGETVQQILDTFRFSLEMNLCWSGFSVFQPLRDSAGDVDEDFEMDEGESSPRRERAITDFVPSKGTVGRTVNEDRGFGESVFRLPRAAIPSREDLREMWFAFNLYGNYVFNKHLSPGGSPEKFVWWVRAIQTGYPTNAGICLFLALAYLLLGEQPLAREQWLMAERALEQSDYWRRRFHQFGLDRVMRSVPTNRRETEQTLQDLRGIHEALVMGRDEMPVVG